MAEFIKQWASGSNLSATYDGSADGEAAFSSDDNEEIDREMSVTFRNADGASAELTVKQEGKRLRFRCKDGLFLLKNGGTFNVLKNGLQ